jgi:hypothetical protein
MYFSKGEHLKAKKSVGGVMLAGSGTQNPLDTVTMLSYRSTLANMIAIRYGTTEYFKCS